MFCEIVNNNNEGEFDIDKYLDGSSENILDKLEKLIKDEKITKELIDEINALARKQRSMGLTDEEKIRQNQLRKKYLAGFRENMKNILDRVEIVDALPDSKLN